MAENPEHKRNTEASRRQKYYSQRYLDIAEVILLGLDRNGFINLINRKGCRVIGYEQQELIGKDWFRVCVPEMERESVFRVYRQIVSGALDFPKYFGNHVLNHRGEQRLIAWHNAPLRDTNGAIIGTLSSGQDITEQRRVEETLRKLSQAVEQSPDMILITDAEGNIEYVNPSFTEISGFTGSDAIGRNPRFLKSGKTPPAVFSEMWDTIKSGEIWRGEVCNKKKNGAYFWNLPPSRPFLMNKERSPITSASRPTSPDANRRTKGCWRSKKGCAGVKNAIASATIPRRRCSSRWTLEGKYVQLIGSERNNWVTKLKSW